MPVIRSGHFTALFLYDVAEAIELPTIAGLVQAAVPSRLPPRPITPAYVQYQQAPLAVDAEAVGLGRIEGCQVRFKVFDYGVISVALTKPLPSSWPDLVRQGLDWHESTGLAGEAERLCRQLIARIQPAVVGLREDFVAEDYLVFSITALDDHVSSEDLLRAHGHDIAELLRGEREPLSRDERDEVLRHRISYLESDLVIPTWSAAFVYDDELGAQGVLELLEFANSQLLEFRYYDGLLERELARIYGQLQAPGWFSSWSRRYTRAAREVHALFIDVNELTDRTENALKIAGDVYAARVLALASARLGLDYWKASVREKLKTVDDIYRFAVERTGMVRGEFLEIVVVLILLIELVLFFMGLMG
jgi:hypothetical protein